MGGVAFLFLKSSIECFIYTAAKLNELRLLSLARRDVEPLHLVILPPHVVTAGPETGAWLEVTQVMLLGKRSINGQLAK
jgi:hypothetical protein